MKFNEVNNEYEMELFALQKEIKESRDQLEMSQNINIDLSQRLAEMEEKNISFKAQIDRLDADVADKTKV